MGGLKGKSERDGRGVLIVEGSEACSPRNPSRATSEYLLQAQNGLIFLDSSVILGI
jgi:hypothetical protein